MELNKCQPILVQGLRRDIEINFHINNIYGSVSQWISAWLKDPGFFPCQGDFFSIKFLLKRKGTKLKRQQQEQEQQLKYPGV